MRLKDKILNKKVIILGGGFRSLITAAFCLDYTKNITIISRDEKNFHGVMSPIKVFGGNFDKGYQFFDGFSEENKLFLEKIIGKNVLYDYGYGASSFTNNKIFPQHGIPYWPHESKILALKSFFFILKNYLLRSKIEDIIYNYQDLLDTLHPDINERLQKACFRNTQKKPSELSYLVSSFSHFLNYRQTLMPDRFSKIFKKIQYFDKRIAARRSKIKLDQISLYPKDKYIGYASELIKENLKKRGVKFLFSDETKILENNQIQIKCSFGTVDADFIFIVTELDTIKDFFVKNLFIDKSNHYVSQVFYYFATNKIFSKFQYVHGNDINININRVSNHSLYGEKLQNGESVLSAEVPTPINSDIWNDPEKFKDKIWDEIISMNFADKSQSFTKCKIFNIPKTLSVPLSVYSHNNDKLLNYTNEKFKNKIFFPGLSTFTRNIFINSARKIIE